MASSLVVLGTQSALADEPVPPEEPTLREEAIARAECAERLKKGMAILESDAHYGEAWESTWVAVGIGAVGLSFTGAFHYSDYRRTENIVRGVESILLAAKWPEVMSLPDTLRGLRTAEGTDPCLALADIRRELELQDQDAHEQTSLLSHSITILLPIVSSVIVAMAVKHWDFAGAGSEGVQTLVGIGLGEAQLLSYPHGPLRPHGASLEWSF
jgi:hypothetical protein